MLNNLPAEILTDIFLFCDRASLVNLTLVCKTFNDIISNNKHILHIMYLEIGRSKDNSVKWESHRKYTRLYASKKHPELLNILNSICNDMTQLRLSFGDVQADDLRKIFLKSPKLKNLEIRADIRNFQDVDYNDPMPELHLDTFMCCCDRKILKFMRNCQVKSLATFRPYNDTHELELLRIFLKNQKFLEKLMFNTFHFDCEIFNDDFLTRVDFRLKSIQLLDISPFNVQNFIKFLKNHRETLEFVELHALLRYTRDTEIYTTKILDALANFRSLKTIDLKKIRINCQPMRYVEHLCLWPTHIGRDRSWSEAFPNIKKASLRYVTNVNSEVWKLSRLEELNLQDCDIDERLQLLPNVKRLKISRFTWRKDYSPIFNGHCLEHFHIEDCCNSDWMYNFLEQCEDRQLKTLWIEGVFLSGNRRFKRVFEKKPHLKDKAWRFVFIDFKDEWDEESIPSEEGDHEMDSDETYDLLFN